MKEQKSFSPEIMEDGTFTGYLSKYGNIDRQGDVILQGAFTDSIKNKNMYPVYRNHNKEKVIGYLEAIDNQEGVFIKGTLFVDPKMNNKNALETYELLKVGALSEMSVGFIWESNDDLEYTETGRIFKKLLLFEGSIVDIPANSQAKIDVVKSHEHSEKKRKSESFKKLVQALLK